MQHSGDQPSDSYSDLALFLQSLANEGRAAVSAQASDVDDADALPVLQQVDGIARDELALDLPAFSPTVALGAARQVHQLCRFAVCRDIPEEHIQAACSTACP